MTNEGIEILLALYRHRYLEKAREMSEEEIEKLLEYFKGEEGDEATENHRPKETT